MLCFWIGLYPKPFLTIIEPSIRRVVQVVDPGYLHHPPLPAAQAPATEPHGHTGG